MAESLAPGHLRLLSDERVVGHNRRNEEMFSDRHPSFVFCDSVSLSNYFGVYRSRKPTACLSPDISGYNLTDVARSVGGGWALVSPGR